MKEFISPRDELLKALYSSDPKDFHQWQFKSLVKSYSSWDLKSRSLNYAADLLVKDIQRKIDIGKREKASGPQNLEKYCAVQMYSVYLMLKGFAFETMLKGFYFLGNGQWSKKVKTHDLVKLAGLFNLDINENDKRYLRALSKYIEWEGRYPTPSCPEKYDDGVSGTNEFTYKQIENNSANYSANISALFDRLVNAVIETLRKRLKHQPILKPASKKVITKFTKFRNN